MLRFLGKIFKGKDDKERYLEKAHDLTDLERRMKEVDRGQAPFQIQSRTQLELRKNGL